MCLLLVFACGPFNPVLSVHRTDLLTSLNQLSLVSFACDDLFS